MLGPLGVITAVACDVVLGDPPAWPHMVRWMGRAVARGEALSRQHCHTPTQLRLAGALIVLAVAGGSAAAVCLLLWAAGWLWLPLAWLVGVVFAFQSVAAGQLWREVDLTAKALREGHIKLARRRLAMIVGRDVDQLDREGIRRALVETLAENLNDGVVAPLFYLALGGPAAAVAYKAVNTMDSMLGYRDERFGHLGLVPARVDDVAGWLPARLTALLIVAACPLLGLNPAGAWRVAIRHHGDHHSPNAGWPEAAAAGALDIRLGGPNYYHGRLVDKPWINPRGRAALDGDVAAAGRLLVITSLLGTLLAAGGAWLLWGWL